MKEKIILLAHGSSDQDWSDTFTSMTRNICDHRSDVSLAFMELSEPSLENAVKQAATDGFQSICVLPLFLAKGRHLKVDVPDMLLDYQAKYSVATRLMSPIGENPMIAQAIQLIIEEGLAGK